MTSNLLVSQVKFSRKRRLKVYCHYEARFALIFQFRFYLLRLRNRIDIEKKFWVLVLSAIE